MQNQLELYVAESQIRQAIDLLFDLVLQDMILGKLRNEIIALRERHIRLSEQKRQEVIGEKELWLRQNKIVNQILAIKDDLQNGIATHKH